MVGVTFTPETPGSRDSTAPYFSRIKIKAFSGTHPPWSPAPMWLQSQVSSMVLRLDICLSVIYLSIFIYLFVQSSHQYCAFLIISPKSQVFSFSVNGFSNCPVAQARNRELTLHSSQPNHHQIPLCAPQIYLQSAPCFLSPQPHPVQPPPSTQRDMRP